MEEILKNKILEEFDQSEYVKIPVDEYQRLMERLEYFKITIKAIKEELEQDNPSIEIIKEFIKELENEIEEKI